MSMMKKYFKQDKKYKMQYKKFILLWQCGGFYEVYGLKCKKTGNIVDSYIETFGKICDYAVKEKSTNSRSGPRYQSYKKDGVPYTVMMSGLPISGSVENKIKKLNQNGFTIALWKQDPKIKEIREEYAIFSPGTQFDVDENLSNNIACIYLKCYKKTLLTKNPRISCGISVIDIITGETKYYEYHTEYFNESINYDDVERFMSIYNPNEIIIIHNFDTQKELNNMIEFSSINCSLKHIIDINDLNNGFMNEVNNCNKQTYQVELLNSYYNFNDSDFFYANFAMYEYATSSFCFLLNFVYNHQKNLVKNIKFPIFDNNQDTLVLANHSLKQLNMINDGNNNTKYSSVLKFLNNCKTAMGKREFGYQLLHPTINETYLNMEYNNIDFLINNKSDYKELWTNKPFKNICDIEKFYRKIILNLVTPYNIFVFNESFEGIQTLLNTLEHDNTLNKYFLNKVNISNISKISQNLQKFKKEINKLKLSEIMSVNTRNIDDNIFKKGIFKDVDESVAIYEKSKIKIDAIKDYFNTILTSFEKKNKNGVKLSVKETMHPFLEATNRRCTGIESILEKWMNQKEKPMVTIKYKYMNTELSFNLDLNTISFEKSSKNNKKIVSPFLNKLYEKIFTGKEEIKKVVRKCFEIYCNNLLNFSNEFEEIINFVKYYDVLVTKVNNALKYNYCKPTITNHEKSYFEANKLRHVLIEQIQQNEIYVPNSVKLGKDEDGILLYGTNAVGKSSLIKSIGICIIMAQSGMYVPCNHFIYKPYKTIYTRILGNDNIFKGLSSFAVEMSELKSILKADCNSLILGDELCKGTEFNSAIRIFVAGLVTLNKTRCSHIFATHFHEITHMKEITELESLVMKHMSIEYIGNTLVYNRTLQDGPGNNNYGLIVCKSLGLPTDFLKFAESLNINFKTKSNNIMNQHTSHYNSKLIKNKCEICGYVGEEVHHMIPQCDADSSDFINNKELSFNKNHKANLMNICRNCHSKETLTGRKLVRKKTTHGYKVMECT